MRKGEATREAIVGEALSQAIVLGLDGISVGGVSQSLSLSKSGVFAHFKSKEALQLDILNAAAAQFRSAVIDPALREVEGLPRLRRLFARYLDWMKDGAGAGGCLFVSAAQEYDDRPCAVRDRLVAILSDWRWVIRRVASDAVARDSLRSDADLEQIAFEFFGLALSYQQSLRLMGTPDAEARAMLGFDRMLAGFCRTH